MKAFKVLISSLGLATIVSVAGCGGGSSEKEITITSAEYKDKWAFTVPELTLKCYPERGSSVTGTYNGREYALNGTARGNEYEDTELIWKENPEIPGTRIGISRFIERGLTLCN